MKRKVSVISLPLNISVLHSVALVVLGEKITFYYTNKNIFKDSRKTEFFFSSDFKTKLKYGLI